MIVQANAGVPMLPIQGVFMFLALIPIMLVESIILRWRLALNWKESIKGGVIANLVSTIAGVPLSWGFMFIFTVIAYTLESEYNFSWDSPVMMAIYFIFTSAWFAPYEGHYAWLIPMALIIMLIPAYFLSLWIEYWVCKYIWQDKPKNLIFQAIRIMNGVTYGVLVGICSVLIYINLV